VLLSSHVTILKHESGLCSGIFFRPCFFPSSSTMQFYYTFLLLFVVLNAYLESSQHVKPPDPLLVIHPNSNLTLGSLAPILPQSEVPQNGVYIQPQNEVFKIVQPKMGYIAVFCLRMRLSLSRFISLIVNS